MDLAASEAAPTPAMEAASPAAVPVAAEMESSAAASEAAPSAKAAAPPAVALSKLSAEEKFKILATRDNDDSGVVREGKRPRVALVFGYLGNAYQGLQKFVIEEVSSQQDDK